VLTDPPYIARYKSRDGRTVPNDDNSAWLKPAFGETFRVLRRDTFCVSFYGWPHADRFIQAYRAAGSRVAGHFVFPKRYTCGSKFLRYQHECAYLLAKGYPKEPADTIGDVIDWTYSGNKLHPTPKPLSVLLPMVETFSPPRGVVLDPFSGSGSSLRRCLAVHGSASSLTRNNTPSRAGGFTRRSENRLQPAPAAPARVSLLRHGIERADCAKDRGTMKPSDVLATHRADSGLSR